MTLFYVISSVFMVSNLNIILLELNDHILLVLLLLQMLVAAKKGEGGGSEVNGQMPLRNSKIFYRYFLNQFETIKLKNK